MNVTLIIPTLNEETNIKLIHRNSKYFSTGKVIIVDGGSEDNTKNCIKKLDLKLIEMSASRGKQLKKGAQKSNSTWLFFMHADSLINKENISEIKKFITLKKNKNRVAFFRLKFNDEGVWSKIISSWTNIRSLIFGLPFGDQCLLIKRTFYFELGGHTDIKIMEDMDLILKIPRKCKTLFKASIVTSFDKYKKIGILKLSILHFLCQLLFILNINNNIIYKIYKRYA
tara:strand:+ start:99 stop:779 length:681 start_codon:yes stop_codon:yes gene_type:complete